MKDQFFEENIEVKNGPLVATAIHDGHNVRESLQDRLNLSDQERLREEDPFTGELARQFDNYIIAKHSRFEVDLNRSPEKAVYKVPEDAWGLHVWKGAIPKEEIEESMRRYHGFYDHVASKLSAIIDTYGYVIVYDIHSYNYRRVGPEGPEANPKENPDIDVLTSGIKMEVWGSVLDKFKQVLKKYPYPDGPLDVREEVRFDGKLSHFMQWILNRFGEKAFVPSIEFKKIFMDEWTGQVDTDKLEHLKKALKQTEPAIMQEIRANQKIFETL